MHSRVIDAAPERVWAALHELRWGDLRAAISLMAIRGIGSVKGLDRRLVEPPSPAAPLFEAAPSLSVSGMIGRPWQPKPAIGPELSSLAQLRAFDEPGWLKYGMEWVLVPLPGERTFVETATICEATDTTARRRFAAYWTVIRAFSGAIRWDILAALARPRILHRAGDVYSAA